MTTSASFTQNQYTLTINVNPVEGGSVIANNTGPYHYGDVVTLTPAPNSGYTFISWSGQGTAGNANEWIVTLTENSTVTATFALEYSLLVTINPTGAGVVIANNTGPYQNGDVVSLTATANTGYTFSQWSGDGTNAETNTRIVTITGKMTVTAIFTQNEYTLTITINPTEAGTVIANNTGPYHYGDAISLIATPNTGYVFNSWSGDGSNTEVNSRVVTITGNMAVTAIFSRASFDFGTAGSPVKSGYTQVTESTLYSAGTGYGWTSIAGLYSRDRTTPNSLNRDLIQSSTDHTFNVDLANGDYQVTVTIGDQSYYHDLIDTYAEDVLKVNDVTNLPGQFYEMSFFVTVSDNQLNLRFVDNGGTDPNWVINTLTIQPAPTLPSEAAFDFGTSGSPVQTGYTQVTESTLYSAITGYGWTSTAGLSSRDRGAPNALSRDLIQSSTDHTFNVDLANGDYQVTVTIGDQSYYHDLIDTYAEDVLKVNDVTNLPGQFHQMSFFVTVSDNQLNLRFVDNGGTDPNWVINTLTIQPAPTLPSEAAFDFGTSGSPVQTGYTQVTESTLYSAITGYGWTSTAGLSSRDRGAPNALSRDLIQSSTDHTFNVDLANGDYQVTVTIGDQSYYHDLIDTYAEDVLKVNDVTNLPGQFYEMSFFVTVSDNQLNLRFVDNGGTDPNWVINTLTIQPNSI